MDLIFVYQALMINSGQSMVSNPHAGYVYFLFLADWVQMGWVFDEKFKFYKLNGRPK